MFTKIKNNSLSAMVTNKFPVMASVLCVLCSLFYGCISPPLPPPSTLRINQVATGPLKGKTIVIDPGHGGPEHGALGPHGLQEAETNLGVALYLWGMLKYAGANALLTRSADVRVYSDTPFSLDKTGPSRDIAKSVLLGLKEKLNVSEGNIYPGNYRVLRTTRAAALLGESSFISNKKNEGRLSYQRTLQLEAEGYFTGILSYYQKGVPVIADLYPHNITLSTSRPETGGRIITAAGENKIDASSLIVKLDGKRFNTFSVTNDNTFSFSPPEPLSNGQHELCVTVKKRDGNSSAETCSSFTVSVPPARIAMSPVFQVIPPDGVSSTAIDIMVFDNLERPVIDGTAVTLSATGGKLSEPVVQTRAGRARALLFSDLKARAVRLTAAAGSISAKTRVTFAPPQEALLLVTIKDPAGNPLSGVEILSNDKRIAVSDERGLAYYSALSTGAIVCTIAKQGFQPVSVKTVPRSGCMIKENVILNQIDGGILRNKKIILDPAGFTQQSLPIITELKKKIEYAGGTVFLTWLDEPAPAAKERIVAASAIGADLSISIEITRRELSAGFYHKSAQGKALAENICQEFDRNKLRKRKKCTPVISNNFMLVQTPMPAVLIRLPKGALDKTSDVVSSMYQALLDTLNKS